MNVNALSLPAGLHVRPSQANDYDFLVDLYKSTRDDLDLIDAEEEFIDDLKLKQFMAQAASYEEQFPNSMNFIVEYQGERVGRVILDFGHNEILIVDISFLPKARNKGLGSGVMQSFKHCSDQVGIPLTLSVITDNISAKAFYQRLGFVYREHHYPRDYLVYYPSGQRIQQTVVQ